LDRAGSAEQTTTYNAYLENIIRK